ncbi:hypothetical protein JL722_15160 [Aureococcus anophagefferens]|nr:hypothetical protein JL722_15160 [Aureococcus anophagefferens]
MEVCISIVFENGGSFDGVAVCSSYSKYHGRDTPDRRRRALLRPAAVARADAEPAADVPEIVASPAVAATVAGDLTVSGLSLADAEANAQVFAEAIADAAGVTWNRVTLTFAAAPRAPPLADVTVAYEIAVLAGEDASAVTAAIGATSASDMDALIASAAAEEGASATFAAVATTAISEATVDQGTDTVDAAAGARRARAPPLLALAARGRCLDARTIASADLRQPRTVPRAVVSCAVIFCAVVFRAVVFRAVVETIKRAVVVRTVERAVEAGRREPNPPNWPETVAVFDETSTAEAIEAAVAAAYATNGGPGTAASSTPGASFLFKPGEYARTCPWATTRRCWASARGPATCLRRRPGRLLRRGSSDFAVGALNTFWRGAENFRMAPTRAWWNGAAGALWAASQASPLRRVDVDADLLLFQYERGYAAGYAAAAVADSVIRGAVRSGSQQHAGRTSPRAAPTAPAAAEKPYVRWAADTAYELVVPARRSDAAGPSWVNGDDGAATVVGFDRVYVADASEDDAASLNAKLAAGLSLVLSPGIYDLDAPLVVATPDQCVLGLGLATLEERTRRPARAAEAGKVDTMVAVDADGVLGDNVWLWRADHDAEGLVYDGANAVANGLRVAGDDATFYGLAVEHQLEDLVVWEGDNGTIFFYQSELPYDVDSYDFAAYRVAPGVDGHVVYNPGVYANFRDHPVVAPSGFVGNATWVNPTTVFLNGEGSIASVLNGAGDAPRLERDTDLAAAAPRREGEDGFAGHGEVDDGHLVEHQRPSA